MSRRRFFCRMVPVVFTILASLMITTHSYAKSFLSGRPFAGNSAVILNSGSTNTCAYTISVALNGAATYITCSARMGQGMLSPQLTNTFFHDLSAAQPLNKLPQMDGCIKTISFGTATYIQYGGQKSPDVSCAADRAGQKLAEDAEHIVGALDFQTMKRSS